MLLHSWSVVVCPHYGHALAKLLLRMSVMQIVVSQGGASSPHQQSGRFWPSPRSWADSRFLHRFHRSNLLGGQPEDLQGRTITSLIDLVIALTFVIALSKRALVLPFLNIMKRRCRCQVFCTRSCMVADFKN